MDRIQYDHLMQGSTHILPFQHLKALSKIFLLK